MLKFTKAFIEDLVADEVMGVNMDNAKECIDEVEAVQHEANLIKKYGLTIMRVIPITEQNKELAYLLNGENEHLISADELNNEDSLKCLSEMDRGAITSGICNNVLLVKSLS